jgi:hemolysin activation/secretion protein
MPLSAVAQDAGAAQRSLQEQRLRGQLRQQRLEFESDSELQPIPIQPDGAANQDLVSPRGGNVLIGQLEIVGAGFLSVQNRAWLASKYLNKTGTEANLLDLQLDVELLLKKSKLLGHVYPPVISPAGSVAVEVIVARLDAVRVVENTTKLSSQWAVNTILDSVRLQSEIRIDKITSGLLKLNDLAGIRAVALFRPGSTPGGTDVLLKLSPRTQRDFKVDFNNYTIEDTGPYQS